MAAGEIHYFVAGSGRGGPAAVAPGGAGAAITSWVAANFTAR